MSHIVEMITNEIETQERAMEDRKQRIKDAPKGYLVCHDSGKSKRLYWEEPKGTAEKRYYDHHRLNDDDYEIAKAIRDRFLFQQQRKRYRSNLKCMRNFLKKYQVCDEETIVNQMEETYRSLGGLKPVEENHMPCTSDNLFKSSRLIHRNSIGEMFRSKSEVHISELLLTNQIPYQYEKKLTINGESRYPDFTIEIPGTNRRKYIEYFGMIDDGEYGGSVAERINWYLNRGIIQGRDILFLFENSRSGIDLMLLWKQIEDFLEI